MSGIRHKACIDDGFNSELVVGAQFDGLFEIPHIPAPKELRIPSGFVPFSKRNRSVNPKEGICFYEMDLNFADVLIRPDIYVDEFAHTYSINTLDCSVYRDMPLTAQIANIYRKQAVGYYFCKHGAHVIPGVRWGDERTYTTTLFSEAVAFTGIEHNSVVSIGTYGCIRGRDNRHHFEAGLEAMLSSLTPAYVLVYGAMPRSIFAPYLSYSQFVQYPDWISRIKGGK